MESEIYTLRDACEILRVQPHIITYLLATGKIPEPRRIGGRRLFTAADLAAISEILKLSVDLQREAYGL
jgi:DNA-binding transcriptional MerR regulator